MRVIAGEVGGHAGPGVTFTPITMVHATLAPGAQARLPWRGDFNALVYVLAGNATAGSDRRPLRTGQLAVLGAGEVVEVGASAGAQSGAPNAELLLLGGLPIREPVVHYGPFVMNTKQEILQALEDFQAGRLGRIPAAQVPHHHVDDIDLGK